MNATTVAGVEEWLAAIRTARHDDEVAHGMEDALREAVLIAIAAGVPDAPALARAALKTADIDFARWCA